MYLIKDASRATIIAFCYKCASNSLMTQYKPPQTKLLTNLAVIELKKSRWTVEGIIRDPFDRLESCYNDFQLNQHQRNWKRFEDIGHFVKAVLNGYSDPHWLPQTEQLLLVDKWVRLEDIELDYHMNRNERAERLTAEQIDSLRDYYAGDLIARNT